jgi:hypothetical protein
MESKVIDALMLMNWMSHHAWFRQVAIERGDFEQAMSQQLLHHFHRDELSEVEDAMTQEEYLTYLLASNCEY